MLTRGTHDESRGAHTGQYFPRTILSLLNTKITTQKQSSIFFTICDLKPLMFAFAEEEKAAWTLGLCAAMAAKQLSGSKALARHALQALCGSHSSYRDAKVGLRLQQQAQACCSPPSSPFPICIEPLHFGLDQLEGCDSLVHTLIYELAGVCHFLTRFPIYLVIKAICQISCNQFNRLLSYNIR